MTQVTEGVYFIQGQDEFIPDSHVYVIGEAGTGDLSVIDAGLMGKGQYKIDSMGKLGIDLSEIKRIIMTHTHLDHIGCLAEIRKNLPNAELWVHTREAAFLERGDERMVYGMDAFRSMCQSQYGIEEGMFKVQVDRKLEGGEILKIGAMDWEVMHIPGHSAGSIALYNRHGKILIPGDTVYADYAIGRYDLYGSSGPDLGASLMSLAELEVDVLLPGHNRIVEDVPPRYILETAKQWAPYLT